MSEQEHTLLPNEPMWTRPFLRIMLGFWHMGEPRVKRPS